MRPTYAIRIYVLRTRWYTAADHCVLVCVDIVMRFAGAFVSGPFSWDTRSTDAIKHALQETVFLRRVKAPVGLDIPVSVYGVAKQGSWLSPT